MLDALEFVVYGVAFWLFVCSPGRWPRWMAEFREAGIGRRCSMVLESAVCAFCGLLPVGVVASVIA